MKSIPTAPYSKQLTDNIIELRESGGGGCVWITLEVVEEAPNPLRCTLWHPASPYWPSAAGHKIHGKQLFILSCLLLVTH